MAFTFSIVSSSTGYNFKYNMQHELKLKPVTNAIILTYIQICNPKLISLSQYQNVEQIIKKQTMLNFPWNIKGAVALKHWNYFDVAILFFCLDILYIRTIGNIYPGIGCGEYHKCFGIKPDLNIVEEWIWEFFFTFCDQMVLRDIFDDCVDVRIFVGLLLSFLPLHSSVVFGV